MRRGRFTRLEGALLAGMLAGAAHGDVAPPGPEALRTWVRSGRLDDAEPALEAALAGDAPGWLVAADGLVELALRRDRPWVTRRRWLQAAPVGLAPVARRDLVVLELDLALRRDDATDRLASLRPATWAPEFARVLALGERFLPREVRRDQLLTWVEELGGPGRAGPELVEALGGALEETGQLARAGAVYRQALLAWNPEEATAPWAPLTESPGLGTAVARLRRTHSTPASQERLRRILQPDENLGWVAALRGWMRRAWALQAVGLPEGATFALLEARRRLPPHRLRPRLQLAGLALQLGHPDLAHDLYRACLILPAGPGDRALQTRRGRGRVLALAAAAQWQRGYVTEAARTLAAAAGTGARVDDVARLFHDSPGARGAQEALADLADLPASLGVGLIAARSLSALHRHARAEQILQATVHEAAPEIALEALAILWGSEAPARAASALAGSQLAHEAPERALERLAQEPPGGLAATSSDAAALAAAASWAATLPTPWSPRLEDAAFDALLTWSHQLSPEQVAPLEARLSAPARELLAWTISGRAPKSPAREWADHGPSLPLLQRGLDVAVARSWQTWGSQLAATLAARESDSRIVASAHLAEASLAARRGHGDGAILAGLRALEAAPGDSRTLELLTEHLEVRSAHRRILQAWAAHVENDHRYARSLSTLWRDTGRARRALGPLLRARRSSPRDQKVAAATGRLLLDEGRHEDALPHLLAAARLGHFAHSPEYAAPLARALTHTGHPDRARKLYRHWLRQDPDGVVRREVEALEAEIGMGDVARLPREALPAGHGD